MKRRLHFQIFRALVLTGIACFAIAGSLLWLVRDRGRHTPQFVEDVAAYLIADLPEADPSAYQGELSERARRLKAAISVWNSRGELLGRAGERLGPDLLPADERRTHWNRDGSTFIALPDGRTLAIAFASREPLFHPQRFVLGVLLLLGTLLLGSWRAARRITRRLERLEHGVTRFGEGNLEVRVRVSGRDEIARLAQAFNRSFDRIAGLLKQQRRMLQSASHELRSPLARVRMALELATEPNVTGATREQLRTDASRDIKELDALIGDLLLAGRLADSELPREFAAVDMRTVVKEEAARVGATADVATLSLHGNGRMLRSLVRNLLENARRYGEDPIRATLWCEQNTCVLRVEDAGQGIASEDGERVFEPFYRPAQHREGKDGGVGLGLSLVKSIAEHHGGTVQYSPSSSGGSRFEVRIPLGVEHRKEV